jgi:hypothetical protein
MLNAIHHATGVRMRRIPATPDRIREAILALAAGGQSNAKTGPRNGDAHGRR